MKRLSKFFKNLMVWVFLAETNQNLNNLKRFYSHRIIISGIDIEKIKETIKDPSKPCLLVLFVWTPI